MKAQKCFGQSVRVFHRPARRHWWWGLAGILLALAALGLSWPTPARAQGSVPLSPYAAWYSGDYEWTRSMAWGDVDGDGDLDLAVANWDAPNKVYLNVNGTLQTPAAWVSDDWDRTCSVAWGDVDGDGDLDLAVGNGGDRLDGLSGGQPNKVYENVNGTLQTTAAWTSGDSDRTWSVAWGDVDGDGDLDLAVGNGDYWYGGQPNKVYLNVDGTLQTAAAWTDGDSDKTTSVAWGDVDGDGDLDLAVGNYGGQPNKVYLNQGGILQTAAAWASGDGDDTMSVAWGDVDGDGDLDLAVGNLDGANKVYLNVNGALQTTAAWTDGDSDATYSVAWGDVDGDGDLDLAVGNFDQPNKVYLNQNGTLETTASWTSGGNTFGVAWGDVDGDGDLDLAVGNRWSQNKVYENVSGPLQTTAAWDSDDYDNKSVAWGDVDGDGDLDLAVGNYNVPNKVYLNVNGTLQTAAAWTSGDYDYTTSVAWGDVDGDGDLDLAAGNYYGGQPNKVYLNQGGILQTAADEPWTDGDSDWTSSVAWGDVDGDGDLDLAVGNGEFGHRQPNKVYLNEGGVLQATADWISGDSDVTTSVAWGDVDGDGDLDLAVGNYNVPNKVYLNVNGTLQTAAAWTSGDYDYTISVAWGDVDGDGDLDLAVGNGGAPNKVYLNVNGTLQTAADQPWTSIDSDSTTSVAWGDVDGDGDLDLVVGNDGQPNKVYLNVNGTLQTAADQPWTFGDGDRTQSVAWGDVDGDGDLDLAVGNYNAPNKVYLNQQSAHPLHPGQSAAVALDLYSDPVQTFSRTVTALAPADFYAGPAIRQDGVIPMTYTLYHPANQPLHVRAFYSLDGGDHWITATATADTPTETLGMVSVVDYRSPDVPHLIPDTGAISSTLVVTNTRRIVDLDVWLNISHTNVVSLHAALVSPAGTVVELFDTVGTSGDDGFRETVLDDQAPLAITAGAPPFTGRFRPTGRLADLDGQVISGTWTLVLTDSVAGGVDQLLGWGLVLNGASPVACASPDPLDLPIPDGGTVTSTLAVSETRPLVDVNVWLNITPTRAADLVVELVSPGGTAVTLLDHVGGDGIGFVNTILDDQALRATAAITPGMAPFTGFFQPAGRLADLDGESPQGTWALRVTDDVVSHTGVLVSWGLWLQTADAGTHVYRWDVWSSGFFGQSDNVVLRLEAGPLPAPGSAISGTYQYLHATPGPYQRPYVSAQTFPFRVRGTQVRVYTDTIAVGHELPGALVYRLPAGHATGAELMANSLGQPFRTDQNGYLQGRGTLGLGDRLVAMVPFTWTDSYTLYHTSATPTPTGLDAQAVTAGGVQTLTVSAAHPLMLFNLDVSLQWDARHDPQYLSQLTYDLQRTSEILYDWTDGQAALGPVTVYHQREHWNEADVRVYASNHMRPSATQGGITSDVITDPLAPTVTYGPGLVHMGAVWNRYGEPGSSLGVDWPRTLAHELGHYALYLDDNYLGLDATTGWLIPVAGCPGAMSDPYREDYPYDEFHAPAGWLPACADTLSQRTTGRADWETIATFYPGLTAPQPPTIINVGPSVLPLAVTSVVSRVVALPTPSAALADPTFYLVDETGARVQPGAGARAFLFQDDWLLDLGQPTLDRVLARGACPGDQVCVYDLAGGCLGCETVQVGDEQLQMGAAAPGWQPDLAISPVTSRTIEVMVTHVPPTLTLSARLFPLDAPASAPVSLTLTGGAYVGVLTAAEPALAGYVQVWAGAEHQGAEVVTDYSLGGNPGRQRGTSPGFVRSRQAPAMSADGQVVLFGALELSPGQFFTLQAATVVFEPLPWATLVGPAYRLVASASITDTAVLSGTSICFSYLGGDVPAGEEGWLKLYYQAPLSTTWQMLPTQLDTYHNTASAPVLGEGLYALMSSVEVPLYGPGWNNFAYPIQGTRPVLEALLSISGCYTTVYGYEAADVVDHWKIYDVTVPDWVNDLQALAYGRGYWINVSVPGAITLYLKGATVAAVERSTSLSYPPATYYGLVLSGAGFTPTAGLPVTAWIDGHRCGQAQTLAVDGQVVYAINVLAQDGSAAGCGVLGRTVTFQVGEQLMVPTAVWDNDRVWELSLSPERRPNWPVYLPLVVKP